MIKEAKKAERAEQLCQLIETVDPRTLTRVLRGDPKVKPCSIRRVRRELEALGMGDLLPAKEARR